MSERISPLRQRMIEDMTIRNLSPVTLRVLVHWQGGQHTEISANAKRASIGTPILRTGMFCFKGTVSRRVCGRCLGRLAERPGQKRGRPRKPSPSRCA